MALLGGLLRGTKGAFVRGSLGAASDVLQAKAESDEEIIKTKVSTYGSRFSDYQTKMQEYDEETQDIRALASQLGAQPEYTGMKIADLEGLAQSLITLADGTNPMEFYLNNRDNLSVAPMTNVSNKTADKQTEDALSTSGNSTAPAPEASEDKRTFMQKIFGGATEEETVARAAERLGISVQEYHRVMAGRAPVRKPPDQKFTMGRADEFKTLLKDSHSNVRTLIGNPESAVYSTEAGTKVAQAYMNAWAGYMTGRQGAPDAETILTMQNTILTAAAPGKASAFFDVYKDDVDRIGARLMSETNPLSNEIRNAALPLYQSIRNIQRQAADEKNGFAFIQDSKNADTYEDNVFALLDVLGLTADTVTMQKRAESTGILIDKAREHALEHTDHYTIPQLELIFSLHGQFDKAMAMDFGPDRQALINKIDNALDSEIIPKIPDTPDKPSTFEEKSQAIANWMVANGFDRGMDAALIEARNRVANGTMMVDGVPHDIRMKDNRATLVPMPMGRYTESGIAQGVRPKVTEHNAEIMSRNTSSIMDIGEALKILGRHPNAYNLFGAIGRKGRDGIDMFNSAFDTEWGEGYVTADLQKATQLVIPLLSTAKNRLFQDPRLSDRDLAIVLDYVGVIRQSGELGLGKSNAFAALTQLRKALIADQMMRMSEQTPERVIGNFAQNGHVIVHDANGEIDRSTVAGELFMQMADSQGLAIKSPAEYRELYEKAKEGDLRARMEHDAYMNQVTLIQDTISYGIQRSQAFRDTGYRPELFRDNYRTESGLIARERMTTTPAQLQSELIAGQNRFREFGDNT